jgi:hypothetical protein
MSRYSSSMSHRSSISSSVAGAPTALRNDAILYLTILSARELKKVQALGEQDPYCSVYLTTGGKEQEKAAFKTDTHDNGGEEWWSHGNRSGGCDANAVAGRHAAHVERQGPHPDPRHLVGRRPLPHQEQQLGEEVSGCNYYVAAMPEVKVC